MDGGSSSEGARSPSAFAVPGSPELEAKIAKVLVHACERELRSLGECSACMWWQPGRGSRARRVGWCSILAAVELNIRPDRSMPSWL